MKSIGRNFFWVAIVALLLCVVGMITSEVAYSILGLDGGDKIIAGIVMTTASISTVLFVISAVYNKNKKRWLSFLLVLAAAGLSLYSYVVFWLSGYGS